ncbi:MAG: TetR/AcrR family transcriptional regulator [Saprospiraceae bacterium]|nr:TetR/AcrR family transcriptional regulator [Saprospiraceae bacterium]MDP4700632.1 TetR/AcrR family transcriptional regulator [Saprospiraceae bacterium]MDP4809615.1 TetR/AcrR family transcriptional regulator [Saprospiraceae bacterium]MDP4914918.1 TetR/AcrR family transcriptional regulator [Saprospiraceae bacterium]MDP5047389.1 TetR/AcrR family transcriptional regulator [Saprospiraceae bacterium]
MTGTVKISDRQLEIIEAAGKILTTSGVSGLTIKNLAKEMKFSESAIYRHFTSKEEIIIALLEFLAVSMDDRYTNTISSEQSPEEKFTTLFQNQFSFFKKNPHFVVAVFSDGLLEESQRINEIILKIMGVKMKHLMPIILEGQQKKVFTNAIKSDELLHIVMGTFRLQMFKWRVTNFQFDISREGDNMIQAVLTLIKIKSK